MATKKTVPVRRPLRREPTHPGEILRHDVLPALRMNVSQAAREP
jgi:plasmid maintenance system antidote protein VapI